MCDDNNEHRPLQSLKSSTRTLMQTVAVNVDEGEKLIRTGTKKQNKKPFCHFVIHEKYLLLMTVIIYMNKAYNNYNSLLHYSTTKK